MVIQYVIFIGNWNLLNCTCITLWSEIKVILGMNTFDPELGPLIINNSTMNYSCYNIVILLTINLVPLHMPSILCKFINNINTIFF